MNKLFILILFSIVGCASAQTNQKIDNLKLFLKKNKRALISPKIDCYSVDTCYINYEKIDIKVIKAVSENDSKDIIVNGTKFLIKTLNNEKEELTIDSLEFPDYTNSTYYFNEDDFYIVNTIPFCTGIACKYRYVQYVDIKNKVVHEKKIKWDK
ncbi:hypothetical protein [Paenimyroides ceti]